MAINLRVAGVALIIVIGVCAIWFLLPFFQHGENVGQIIKIVVDYPSEIDKEGGVGSIHVALENMNNTDLRNLTLYIYMDNLIPIGTNLVVIDSLKPHEIRTKTFEVRSIRGVKEDTASFKVYVNENNLTLVSFTPEEPIKIVRPEIKWAAYAGIIMGIITSLAVVLTFLSSFYGDLRMYFRKELPLDEKIKKLEYEKGKLDLIRELRYGNGEIKLKKPTLDELEKSYRKIAELIVSEEVEGEKIKNKGPKIRERINEGLGNCWTSIKTYLKRKP
ncbi:hypothetical protein C5S31_08150 [ANME-1 cluster archaeon GoMg2]|nr:hypothetical protein [ANME-1 cluster archaeon GoMg2]